MTTINPEAGAARARGARAADAGEPRSACPHPAGGWLALNWLVGHALALGQRDAADVFREGAKRALKRERRGRTREALAVIRPVAEKPERPSKPCARAGCTGRVVWRSGRSRAEWEQASHCSKPCRDSSFALAEGESGARANALPVRVCKLDGCDVRLTRKQRSYCCWAHFQAAGGLGAAGQKAARPKRHRPKAAPAPVVAGPPAPAPVVIALPRPIPLAAWHAARDGVSADAMRRLFGLDDDQTARVLELQRRGGRKAA